MKGGVVGVKLTPVPPEKTTFKKLSLIRVKETLQDSVNNFQYYPVELDESVNVEDTAQLAIFVRGINSEFIITEELVELVSLKGSIFGKDILDGFLACASQIQLNLKKLVSDLTDGDPAIVGSKNGNVSLLKKHVKEIGDKLDIFKSHCIIH